ncbi:sialate O-acetylesterase [Asticcacaulis sp. BYS171W]|uniref:Sialate O-acetylesterase n=1 Tax=Asticcacaulis aquaticus TaxID=2984212 RepID=A0ABT5HQA1_9CAUL|nr:sialate O-acetylesterase [Asticcacaulis aquaticus]MDC7682117.1 sialate O-acetylesterase [Asticcacaulis aquaticus]
MNTIKIISLTVAILTPTFAWSDVRLPAILSDHMTLQGGQSVSVWGWADPGEKVDVRIAGQTVKTKAGLGGQWRVQLKPMKSSSQPIDMIVKGKANTLTVKDILIGEVWLASGQSNMEMPFRWGKFPGIFDYKAEMTAANYPEIRIFKVKKARGAKETNDVEGHWIVCTPDQVTEEGFSAAGYYFARRLNGALGTPVGLIDSTWGGTRIEEWISTDGFRGQSSLKRFLAVEAGGEKVDGIKRTELFNGMIAPLSNLTIKGVIWYQGEGNASDYPAGDDYADKMRALVGGWRTAFKSDVPFYYVQIAPYLYHIERPLRVASPEAAPLIQEAQTDALSVPGTGMVVVSDLVDDLADIHPRNKKDVGERLAGWALAKTYGRSDLVFSGPRFKSMAISEGRAILTFDFVGGGLASRDKKPITWFAVAGADGVYFPAKAEISGDQIIVSSPFVSEPMDVRFAWDEGARSNLMNKEGLPAWPFRTRR